jgi:hypothetical protein
VRSQLRGSSLSLFSSIEVKTAERVRHPINFNYTHQQVFSINFISTLSASNYPQGHTNHGAERFLPGILCERQKGNSTLRLSHAAAFLNFIGNRCLGGR